MSLSAASNPLTAPLPPLLPTVPTERALARFAVHGNAVITGGAGTLALASARALLEHGLSNLAILDLPNTLVSSAASIRQLETDFAPSRKIFTIPVNVTDHQEVVRAMKAASEAMTNGSIDILCCFAGTVSCLPTLETSANEWVRVMDVNLTGAFLAAQEAARYMISSNTGGNILFIASISGHLVNWPQPQAAYNVSKAAVLHLTRSLAVELARYGIRVNSISPGYMDTVLNAGDSLAVVREQWALRCPMSRMGETDELTGAVVMLASQRAARYMTGTDIVIDGGTSCF